MQIEMKNKIVELAEAIKSNDIDFILGVREIRKYFDNDLNDEFTVFTAIDSDTDHLPEVEQRDLWNKEKLEEKDAEKKKIKEFYSASLFEACDTLIKRFGN